MRKHWRKIIWPFWTLFSIAMMTAAIPQQSTLEEVPWWVWLIVITVILLVMFGLVLAVDFRSAGNQNNDNSE